MWLALAGAILVEVFATLSLRASDGFRKKAWIVPVIAGVLLVEFGSHRAAAAQS